MKYHELEAIAAMVVEIIAAAEKRKQSGPSFDLDAAVTEAIERASELIEIEET